MYEDSKTFIGFILGLIFGLIGLIFVLVLFPYNTIERDTSLHGWAMGILTQLGLAFIIGCGSCIFFL